MTFKELRTSFPVYLLSKGEEITFSQAKTVDVSQPHINANFTGQFPMQGGLQPLIVDVTIDNNGTRTTYNLPENVSAYAVGGNVLISTNKEDILRELQATKSDCEEYLANYDKRKAKLEQCDKLIGEIDTVYRDRQEMEKRMADIETNQKKVDDKLDKILGELAKYRKQ